MTFWQIYLQGLLLVTVFLTLAWVLSVIIKNASIVDIFWGFAFVFVNSFYFFFSEGSNPRKYLLLFLVTIWGLRLSIYILGRNLGKPEDFRYQNFRQRYGPNRYWWFSFFQVFMLQGVLLWLISAPLLAVQMYSEQVPFGVMDFLGITV